MWILKNFCTLNLSFLTFCRDRTVSIPKIFLPLSHFIQRFHILKSKVFICSHRGKPLVVILSAIVDHYRQYYNQRFPTVTIKETKRKVLKSFCPLKRLKDKKKLQIFLE